MNKIKLNIPLYIVHYKKLTDRKSYLSAKFNDINWVDMFDRENLTPELSNEIYIKDLNLWSQRTAGIYKNGGSPARPLKVPEICCILSHVYAYKQISKEESNISLILEDDVLLNSNENGVPQDSLIDSSGKYFTEGINHAISNFPEDCDIMMLGSAFTLDLLEGALENVVPITPMPDQVIYKRIPPATRTVDAYLITKKAANALYESFKELKATLPIDWELNYHFNKLGLKVYWRVPGIVTQGSQVGIYGTTIQNIAS